MKNKTLQKNAFLLKRVQTKFKGAGKNPFQLDSKEPQWEKFQSFLQNEIRFASLTKSFPAEAQELFKAAEKNAKWRYNSYVRMGKLEY